MKTFCFFIVGYMLFIACKSEKPTVDKTVAVIDSSKKSKKAVFAAPQLDEHYYRELFKIQQDIVLDPANREKKEKFIFNAYFPENNALLSFGSARKINPSTNQNIPYPLQKRAAVVDAKRWATYGLLWISNDFKPDFGKISDVHVGETQEVFSFESGDSLIIVLANKVL